MYRSEFLENSDEGCAFFTFRERTNWLHWHTTTTTLRVRRLGQFDEIACNNASLDSRTFADARGAYGALGHPECPCGWNKDVCVCAVP